MYSYWRDFGARYVTALCTRQESDARRLVPPALQARNWSEWRIGRAAHDRRGVSDSRRCSKRCGGNWTRPSRSSWPNPKCGVQDFLKRRNPAWNLVGRVHFNLAENRKDPDAPFAFLATYTTRLSAHAKAQHLPLGQALREYAGAANKDRLLSLLLPVQRASETCPWLKAMVDAGEIFHPLRWTPREALQLLRDVPHLETAGVVVRMPAAWRGNRPPRPRVTGTVGAKAPVGLGQDALLDFRMEVTLDGEPLTAAEIRDAARQIRRAGAGPRALGRSRPRTAAQHDGALPRGRARGPGERPQPSARPCGCSPAPTLPPDDAAAATERRLGPGGGRPLARRDA